jgi:L-glyceraldehyde 3-phosphate reductase
MGYQPSSTRYQQIPYKRCGASGLKLPAISLGLWQNFGDYDTLQNSLDILTTAFDNGITHFDLANNYGPPRGSAEENFGRILHSDFRGHRDELIISTKAGYTMWDGPYGDWGSKKYLVSSLDQSLKRMRLNYVDIFYHHRPDLETPLEETMAALSLIVQQGKALYIGISNYKAPEAKRAITMLKQMGTPAIIHQPKYSMFERWVENGLLDLLEQEEVGCIPFSPLAQGLLTDKYLKGIPPDSRALKVGDFLTADSIKPDIIQKVQQLNEIAKGRGQKLAQMALSWILKDERITSVLIGASKPWQILDSIKCIENTVFNPDELTVINNILNND